MADNIRANALMRLASVGQLRGTLTVPGDKSISHRAMMFGALAEGVTKVKGFLRSEDCIATLNIMRQMGVQIEDDGDEIRVHGVGLHGLEGPQDDLDCGNAGTAMRLLSGILAGQSFNSTLVGDESLSGRPMNRVIKPLSQMGARIDSDQGTAPLKFSPVSQLNAMHYDSPIASAQVKSAVLLAGLYAEGVTSVTEPRKSRDHTETMLKGFGAEVKVNDLTVAVNGQPKLQAQDVQVPADISSAAFFMVLALCHPDADITIENVCVNTTRDGVIHILKAMGGDIELTNRREVAGEAVADIRVQSSHLKGIDVPHQWIPSAIDEFPVVFIAAAHASGAFKLTGAEELRHKESDRIAVMVQGLQAMGVVCSESHDGVVIQGQGPHWQPKGACLDGHGDHRCAMGFLVNSALHEQSDLSVKGCHNIATSFPNFFDLMADLQLPMMPQVPVVTIDGPSGVGKGTISALLAQHLCWHLLDSGAIYRGMALQALASGIAHDDEQALSEAAVDLDLSFEVSQQGTLAVLNGQVVNDALREEATGDMASKIATVQLMRDALFERQKAFQQAPGLVADGRDMGTVVFPSAPLKVFLTASAEERAKRRHKQLQEKGVGVKIRDLLKDIEARDARDSSRKVAPLVPAQDAFVIDTSDLNIEAVLQKVIDLAEQHI